MYEYLSLYEVKSSPEAALSVQEADPSQHGGAHVLCQVQSCSNQLTTVCLLQVWKITVRWKIVSSRTQQ